MTERNFLAKYFTKYRKNIHHLLSLKVKEDEIREKEDQIKNLMEENLNLKFELSNLVKIIQQYIHKTIDYKYSHDIVENKNIQTQRKIKFNNGEIFNRLYNESFAKKERQKQRQSIEYRKSVEKYPFHTFITHKKSIPLRFNSVCYFKSPRLSTNSSITNLNKNDSTEIMKNINSNLTFKSHKSNNSNQSLLDLEKHYLIKDQLDGDSRSANSYYLKNNLIQSTKENT